MVRFQGLLCQLPINLMGYSLLHRGKKGGSKTDKYIQVLLCLNKGRTTDAGSSNDINGTRP